MIIGIVQAMCLRGSTTQKNLLEYFLTYDLIEKNIILLQLRIVAGLLGLRRQRCKINSCDRHHFLSTRRNVSEHIGRTIV